MKKVVAIGECGLEYYHIKDKNLQERQKDAFIKHLELAKEVGKPVIIHCRDAHNDLLEILRLEDSHPRGVMHFFTGTLEQAKNILIWVFTFLFPE